MEYKKISRTPSIMWGLMGIITIFASFIIEDCFILCLGLLMFLVVFLNELDIYLSRRAGVDPDRDYVRIDNKGD